VCFPLTKSDAPLHQFLEDVAAAVIVLVLVFSDDGTD